VTEGGQLVEGFGLTECSPVTHANPFNGVRKAGSIGLPIPDTDVRIMSLDDPDKEMPIGEPASSASRAPR
jgi:Acyl-CoA synthetases (AMP-forming)/AMP-acid ligases II